MPTTTYWVGNAAAISAVLQATVTGVGVGGTLTATINGKVIQYTSVTGDTAATAATAWLALLGASTAPPEFQSLTWASGGSAIITATAKNAGQPFFGMTGGLVFTAASGCTVTTTTVNAGSSPSDVGLAQNYRRNNIASLPQGGDDLVVADSAVPLLYNLNALASVALASYTRYQSFTGTVGLPQNNPNGYFEYLPTYLKLNGGAASSSSASPSPGGGSVLNVLLGFGPTGSGPTRERYDFQTQQVNCTVLATGTPLDAYGVRFLGSNSANLLTVMGPSVGVAMLPGETATLAGASVTNSGRLDLGPAVTFSGTLTVTGAVSDMNCTVPVVLGQQGAGLSQGTVAGNLTLTYPNVSVIGGSTLIWRSPSAITALVLQTGSLFDKGTDQRAITVGTLTLDWDSCVVNDPFNAVTYGSIVTKNACNTGPFRNGAGKKLPINP